MDLIVRDVMSPNPCVISPTASVLEAAQNELPEGTELLSNPGG